MQISARNTLKGKVKRIHLGDIDAEVIIELPGGIEVVAAVTTRSCERLALEVGKEAYAVIKATSVMVAVD
ncbi:MAG: transporter [Cyanobacteria bacterium RYN_339]|nr:transporter [Cyanobacteria bacterium RYN_339]